MRIDKNERIAGLSALDVRCLLREIGESHIDVGAAAKVLGMSKRKATKALAGLLSSGLLVEDNGKYTPTRAPGAAVGARQA